MLQCFAAGRVCLFKALEDAVGVLQYLAVCCSVLQSAVAGLSRML